MSCQAILHWFYKATMEHEAVIGIIALAFIMAMPPRLPDSFWDFPQWSWGWLHDGLKNVVSIQHPGPGETRVTEARSVQVETGNPPTITPPAPVQQGETEVH